MSRVEVPICYLCHSDRHTHDPAERGDHPPLPLCGHLSSHESKQRGHKPSPKNIRKGKGQEATGGCGPDSVSPLHPRPEFWQPHVGPAVAVHLIRGITMPLDFGKHRNKQSPSTQQHPYEHVPSTTRRPMAPDTPCAIQHSSTAHSLGILEEAGRIPRGLTRSRSGSKQTGL